MSNATKQDAIKLLDVFDPEMASLLHREEKRQFETVGLIASENVVSPMASCLEGSASSAEMPPSPTWRSSVPS